MHGIASVFCNPELRRRGFAARLMRELAQTLPDLEFQSRKAIGSILYSDIGKTYYSNLGWHAALDNVHLEFESIRVTLDPHVKLLREEDLAGLCEDDEAMSRQAMVRDSNGKRQMMILPDVEHMLWHQSKENFASEKLFGTTPETKGAIAGEPGHRVWAVWTHRYYGDPSSISSDNTLYILRLVIENQQSGHEEDLQIHFVHAVIQAARSEAAEWLLPCVKLWNPTPSTRDLIMKTGIPCTEVERVNDSIASIMWFGTQDQQENTYEWIGNEKYAWC